MELIKCWIKVKKKKPLQKPCLRSILLNVGPKKIVISQNRSNWKRHSQDDLCRDWSNNELIKQISNNNNNDRI